MPIGRLTAAASAAPSATAYPAAPASSLLFRRNLRQAGSGAAPTAAPPSSSPAPSAPNPPTPLGRRGKEAVRSKGVRPSFS